MRKIIGFKLSLRIKEIQRRAKKAKLDLDALGLPEPGLQIFLDKAVKEMKPAVVFDTFSHPDADQPLLSPMPGLAYSLVIGTLGAGFEAVKAADAVRQNLWPLVEEHALEETVRFATSLLEDEALNDSCELSPLSAVVEAAALKAALKKVDASKIGVSAADGRLAPACSTACSLSWLSKSKTKGGAPPRGKSK